MLNEVTIERTLNAALETGGDFAEIYMQDRVSDSLNMSEGVLEKAISGRCFGIGIRIFKGCFSVYAYTNNCSENNLIKVARCAALGISDKEKKDRKDIKVSLKKNVIENRHEIKIIPDNIDRRRKTDWLLRAYNAAKSFDNVITQVYTSFNETTENVLIANTEGLLVEDKRCRNRLFITAVAEADGNKEIGYKGPGYFGGLEYMDGLNIESVASEAAKSAKIKLNASYAPTGKFPVVINNGFGGVLFHEACGHGLEATNVAYKASVFADKLGQYVASPIVTAYDDGTIKNEWGSSNIDDEGMKTHKNLLIKDGILKGYLVDRLGSRIMGMPANGSARRESYEYAATSRMHNTYIAPGKSEPEDIISNTEYGIYAKEMGGGSVNAVTGDYNFNIDEGYIIKNGKIEEPIKGATLIGNGLDTLKKIDMVGNNLRLGIGVCGSVSGSVPVTVGQPTIRISELTVGGREK